MFLKNKNIIFKIRRSKVTDYAALNISLFSKKLGRTITFNSVTLKNTQTEPKKYIIFFNETNNRVGG